jgi:8-amino-7-oxononanoate synthase
VVAFCSNDYLGLAGDQRLCDALSRGAMAEGAGAGAARLISGNRPSHLELEREAAAFKGRPAALLFGSGYLANTSLMPALAGRGDLIVSDRLNHASLIDGCRLSRAAIEVVPHRDPEAVRQALVGHDGGQRYVVTEGLFSMGGHAAPLAELLHICRANGATLIVDDAHGNGVLGPTGRGAVEAAGLEPAEDLIEVGTFGKAFGGYGAFVCWTRRGVDMLIQRARGFFFSTGLPPGVAAMSLEGLRLAQLEPERRERLGQLSRRLRIALGDAVEPGDSPIVPLVVGSSERAESLARQLLEQGLWIPPIRPPTVPEGGARLRISLSAAHSDAQLDRLISTLLEAL